MNRRMVIAVDGPAGSGKSTVCREAALELGIKYIDSGAVYRALTWYLLKVCPDMAACGEFAEKIKDLIITQRFTPDGGSRTFVNGEDVSEEIRTERITGSIGVVSDDTGVRNFVNTLLREWSREESVIMDGRDIGSVVFPDADLKVYLDASVDERARRRISEYEEKGKTVDGNAIRNQIIRRDREDESRPFGRLVKNPDALYLDTSAMARKQVVDWLVNAVLKAMETR